MTIKSELEASSSKIFTRPLETKLYIPTSCKKLSSKTTGLELLLFVLKTTTTGAIKWIRIHNIHIFMLILRQIIFIHSRKSNQTSESSHP